VIYHANAGTHYSPSSINTYSEMHNHLMTSR